MHVFHLHRYETCVPAHCVLLSSMHLQRWPAGWQALGTRIGVHALRKLTDLTALVRTPCFAAARFRERMGERYAASIAVQEAHSPGGSTQQDFNANELFDVALQDDWDFCADVHASVRPVCMCMCVFVGLCR